MNHKQIVETRGEQAREEKNMRKCYQQLYHPYPGYGSALCYIVRGSCYISTARGARGIKKHKK